MNKVISALPLPPTPQAKKAENLYWVSYRALEEEYLASLRYVLYTKDHLNVYSSFYLDLLLRIRIEIEALSKRLYVLAGGQEDTDKSKTYFDSVCLKYLNEKWNLGGKEIWAKYPDADHWSTLAPLKGCHIKGDEGASWKSAYQAVKHNKEKNASLATLENCLFSLGALYILNIFYRDEAFSFTYESGTINLDWSFGSKLFACTHFEYSHMVNPHSIYAVSLAHDYVKRWDDAANQSMETFSKLVEGNSKFIDYCKESPDGPKPFRDLFELMSVVGESDIKNYLAQAFAPYFRSIQSKSKPYYVYILERHPHDPLDIDVVGWLSSV